VIAIHWSNLTTLLAAGAATLLAAGAALLLAAAAGGAFQFSDVAESSGIHFVLENSPTPKKFEIETMPGGIAVFDYNGDGLPDIYFTNGADVPSLEKKDSQFWNRL
jgi:hypothetical protein